jgi:hypothetical protein
LVLVALLVIVMHLWVADWMRDQMGELGRGADAP